ncbi:MAG: fumarylacetoacetase [Pseudomonadota bacterium]
MNHLNTSHDPARRSWITSANLPGSDFPIQNLPFGIFSHQGNAPHAGIAIGEEILDLAACIDAGLLDGDALAAAQAAREPFLNTLMGLGPRYSSALRCAVSDLLRSDSPRRAEIESRRSSILVPAAEATMMLPCRIGNYTDFLTSAHHTERLGKLKGLDIPLPPAFKSLPVAYHSRASSVRVSGHAVQRPNGQWKDADGTVRFGRVEALDFELEMALFIGSGNLQGHPIPLKQARDHIFGYCLLNDWSAKSVQWWEQVLGPFLGKSFCTTISPWIVTDEALAPFRVPARARAEGDPAPLPYLSSDENNRLGGLDVQLEAYLSTQSMRAHQLQPERISATNLTELYWNFPQMVTHHASNGCNLQPADLMGSGTVSGSTRESIACMTEMTGNGKDPILLKNGEQRHWLADHDEVIFRARAVREGYVTIGFGECRGQILPAIPWPD